MTIVAFIFTLVSQVVRVLVRKTREAKPNSLCMDCLNAHVQYAANGRRSTSCGYGGTMRPMKLDVLYCTDYGARNQPVPARAVGFVRENCTLRISGISRYRTLLIPPSVLLTCDALAAAILKT